MLIFLEKPFTSLTKGETKMKITLTLKILENIYKEIPNKLSPLRKTRSMSSFETLVTLIAFSIVIGLYYAYLSALLKGAMPAFQAFGWRPLLETGWNPVNDSYGVLTFVLGTLATSIIAIAISLPFSIAVSLFISEYTHPRIGNWLRGIIDMLAAIPSVIYGLWGIFVLVPLLRKMMALGLSFLNPNGTASFGFSILAAGILLSLMILPIQTNIFIEAFETVPQPLLEGMYALGATEWEVSSQIIVGTTKSSIVGGSMLSFGRALGETIAVTMVIGNSIRMPTSIFDPGQTISSLIANEFAEASGKLHLAMLFELALILLLITAIFNVLGTILVHKLK